MNSINKIIVVILILFLSIFYPAVTFSQPNTGATAKEEEAIFVAQKAINDGFYELAQEMLERFIKTNPKSQKIPEAQLLIAQSLYYQNKYLQAMDKLNTLLESPQSKSLKDAVYYWIAEVHLKGRDFMRAKSFYERIIKEFPDSDYVPSSLYSLGWCAIEMNKFDEALNNLNNLREKFPNSPLKEEAFFKIIEALSRIKDYNRQKVEINRYLAEYPQTKRLSLLYFYRAEANFYLGSYQEALGDYAMVLEHSHDEHIKNLAKTGLAWSHLKLNNFKEAKDNFSKIDKGPLDKNLLSTVLLGEALSLTELGDFSQGFSLYKELIQAAPPSNILLQALWGQAQALCRQEKIDEAILIYRKIIQTADIADKEEADILDEARNALASIYLKRGDFQNAIMEFKILGATGQDPTVKANAFCQAAGVYQDLKEYQKAYDAYSYILKEIPDNTALDFIHYQMAACLIKLEKFDLAINLLDAFVLKFPQSKFLNDANYSKGSAYYQKKDYASAIKKFKELAQYTRDLNIKSNSLYMMALCFLELGQYQEAISIFQGIIKEFSTDPDLISKCEFEIAALFYKMGNSDEALSRFKAIINNTPQSQSAPEAIYWLADYYYKRQNFQVSRRYFGDLVRSYPKSNLANRAIFGLGLCFYQEGSLDEALNESKKITTTDPELKIEIAQFQAGIFLRKDDSYGALNIYQKLSQSTDKALKEAAYLKMADIYRDMSDYDLVIDSYKNAIVNSNRPGLIHLLLAGTLQEQGKLQPAINEYLKIAQIYPDDLDTVVKAYLRAAELLEEKENWQKAQELYKKVVDLDVPESKYASERLKGFKKNNF